MPYTTNLNCTGCGECVSRCTTGAMHLIEENGVRHSRIDQDVCVSCGHCAHFCKSFAIVDTLGRIAQPIPENERLMPCIDREKCSGCMLCNENCPEYALGTEMLTKHYTISRLEHPDACLGCGLCAKNCPVKAITMVKRRDYT